MPQKWVMTKGSLESIYQNMANEYPFMVAGYHFLQRNEKHEKNVFP